MKFKTVSTSAVFLLLIASCTKQDSPSAPPTFPQHDDLIVTEEVEPEDPENPSKRRLPRSVVIVSDANPSFGIDTSKLSPDHADLVASAWRNYSTILSGGDPDCTEAFGVSDGGTIGYYCDGYDIARVHSLSSKDGVDGYDYGPSLDLLNGQRIKRIKFYSDEQLAELKRAAR